MSRRARMRTPPPYVDTRPPIMRPSRSHHEPYDDYHPSSMHHHHRAEPYPRMPPQRIREHPLPPPPATYKILCVTNLNYKVSDGSIREALLHEFGRYGDISVRVCHDGSERLAYVYFRCYEEAREARHEKSRLVLFDRLVEIDPIYEHRSSSSSSAYSAPRRRSNTPPEYLGMQGPRRSSPPPPMVAHSSRSRMVPPPRSSSLRTGPSSPYERHSSSSYSNNYESRSSFHNHSSSSSASYRDRDRGRDPHGPDPYSHTMPRSPRYDSSSYHHPESRAPSAYASSSASHRVPPPPPALPSAQASSSSSSSASVGGNTLPAPHHHRHHTPPSSGPASGGTHQRLSPASNSSNQRANPVKDLRKEKFPNYLLHIAPEDDDKATRTLFVGNLEVSISDSELRRIFERFGIVEDIDVKRPPPGQGNAYAFIRFANLDMAHKAKVEMSGQYIGKFQCKIGYGKATPTKRLWIGGLGTWVTLQQLEQEFERFGTIIKIEYNKGDDFAYVEYEKLDAAQTASQDMRGHQMAGSDKRLRIDFADTEDDPAEALSAVNNQMSPEFAARQVAESESDEIRTLDEEGIDEDGVTISDSVTSITELAKCCPVSWNAALVLKNSVFTSRMFLCSGDIALVDKYITESDSSDLPTLKISQRLRLDPPKLDDVTRRMNADGIKNYSMFLILDCQLPINNQTPGTPTATSTSTPTPTTNATGTTTAPGSSPQTNPDGSTPGAISASTPPSVTTLANNDNSCGTTNLAASGDSINHVTANNNNNNDSSLSNNNNKDNNDNVNAGNSNNNNDSTNTNGDGPARDNDSSLSCSKPLKNLIAYLRQKDAAGVVAFKDTDSKSSDVYMYAFPPCRYAIDLVRQAAPNLTTDPIQTQKDNFLVGLIVKGK
ncbi:RNA-binding protein spenito, partial [Fragariocoptes setiger]